MFDENFKISPDFGPGSGSRGVKVAAMGTLVAAKGTLCPSVLHLGGSLLITQFQSPFGGMASARVCMGQASQVFDVER